MVRRTTKNIPMTFKQYTRAFKGVCGRMQTNTERSKIGTGKVKRKHIARREFQTRNRIAFWGGEKFEY